MAIAHAPQEQPCIRCGDCAVVCPEQLQPQRLLLHLRDERWAQAEHEGLQDCTACGRCDAVCPSRIPLARLFRQAKAQIAETATRRTRALAARERYRSRQARLSRDEDAREERIVTQTANAASTDAVAAAIARAQAKRAARAHPPKA